MAFLAFKLRIGEGRNPPHRLRLNVARQERSIKIGVRTSMVITPISSNSMYQTIWRPPSGDVSEVQKIATSLAETVSTTRDFTLSQTWAEDHCIINTVSSPESFEMAIKPQPEGSQVRGVIAFAVAVKFLAEPQEFTLRVALDRGEGPLS
jgi:hypothetical protein